MVDNFNPAGRAEKTSENITQASLEAICSIPVENLAMNSFLSEALLEKINQSVSRDPERLKKQLDELASLYCAEKTLACLGMDNSPNTLPYQSIALTLPLLFLVADCHLFQVIDGNRLELIGSSADMKATQRFSTLSINQYSALQNCLHSGAQSTVLNFIPNDETSLPKALIDHKQAVLVAPFKDSQTVEGLLVLVSDKPDAFSLEMTQLAEAVAQVLMIGLSLQALINCYAEQKDSTEPCHNKLQEIRNAMTAQIADLGFHQKQFVEALSSCIDARYDFTRGESTSIAKIAMKIAKHLNLNEKTVDLVYRAGLLSSLGKAAISESVINKAGKLTVAEKQEISESSHFGVNLLHSIHFLGEVIPYVYSQYEYWNGSGEPEQLKGRSIPLGSRILAVASAYYAMTQERPYRDEGMSPQQALNMLSEESGRKWDPMVVSALLQVVG